MLNRNLILTAVLTVSSLALAQQNSKQGTRNMTASPNATTTCAATFTSGTGVNATQFCVTKNGNITQFSRGGTEYIQVNDVSEGYGICDGTTSTRYFDYAANDSGNLGAATFSSTASKAVSTRTTSDGIWQITNTITKVNANGSGPGAAKVSMQIKNLTNSTRTIALTRMADMDFLASGGTPDTNNDFDFTVDTAYGLEPNFNSGLSLTNNTFSNIFASAFTLNSSVGPDPCNLSAAPQPFVGDGSIAMFYEVRVPKNATKTFNMTYKPM
jgi:hypothetical protein